MALRQLVDVLSVQLAKAEDRAAEDRQQLRAERERSAAAEGQARALRRLLDVELVELRAMLVSVRITGATVQAASAQDRVKPLREARRPPWWRRLGL